MTSKYTNRLTILLTPEQRELIRAAAKADHRSESAFGRLTLVARAKEILAARTHDATEDR